MLSYQQHIIRITGFFISLFCFGLKKKKQLIIFKKNWLDVKFNWIWNEMLIICLCWNFGVVSFVHLLFIINWIIAVMYSSDFVFISKGDMFFLNIYLSIIEYYNVKQFEWWICQSVKWLARILLFSWEYI